MLFRSKKFVGNFGVSGVTKDSTGAVLGNCTVKLFQTADDVMVAQTVSDASGNYTVMLGYSSFLFYYLVVYKAGSPDVAGTTVNTLTLSQI